MDKANDSFISFMIWPLVFGIPWCVFVCLFSVFVYSGDAMFPIAFLGGMFFGACGSIYAIMRHDRKRRHA